MKKYSFYIFILLFCSICICSFKSSDWGFYGHRKINRMAVFTLPSDMIKFFKDHIEFLTEHAVDPDKRRYAAKHEAVRHYIDIDHWGSRPFDAVPRKLVDAVVKFGDYQHIKGTDTLILRLKESGDRLILTDRNEIEYSDAIYLDELIDKIGGTIQSEYYEGSWEINMLAFGPSLVDKLRPRGTFRLVDQFSSYGILPYHLYKHYFTIVKAFKEHNIPGLLRQCAEMGHYIGDAHVPLHTTENYNGQFTNQVGIHGFWESRIPELFADEKYDFFVGKAEYIDNKRNYFWNIIQTSHGLLDSVLLIEKRLSEQFPEDKQFCYDERLERSVRIQCPEYAYAYQQAMKGMVELRMQESIQAIGSVWYSAWIDAGQPDLDPDSESVYSEKDLKEQEILENSYKSGSIYGREHK